MKTEYHSSFPIIFFLVIVEKFIVFFCTWEISSLHHSVTFRLITRDVVGWCLTAVSS